MKRVDESIEWTRGPSNEAMNGAMDRMSGRDPRAQGKIADLENKLEQAMSPQKRGGLAGGEGGKGAGEDVASGDGNVMKTMMMAQFGVMTVLVFVLCVLIFVLVKNAGGFHNFLGL